MKKFFCLFFLGASSLFAQVPSWVVDESLFEFSMSFVAKIHIDGERLTSSSDLVGAFVAGQCRGVANPTYIASSDAYYVYLTVFGNTTGETITFKVYRSDTNEEITISRTVDFESNQHIGSRFQSFSIAEPPLRSDAELTSFGFNGQVADSLSISDDNISFFFVEDIDQTQLTPNFTMSDGARAFIRQVEQTSGVGVRDFSSPVIYQIMSEDESVLNEVTINVFDENNGTGNGAGNPSNSDSNSGSNSSGGNSTSPQVSFNISQSNEDSQVNEDGSQDNFIVFLNRQPIVQAVFTITSSDPEEVRVLNPEIIFTPDNINLAQFVYLEGVDDDIQDGNQTSTITIRVDPTRSDAMFASLPAKSFSCITLDNDNIPRIIVLETNDSSQVDESESEDTVFVSLGTAPTSEVTINVGVDDPTEVSVNPSSLTFTSDNWFVPQSIMINGVDDELVDGSQKTNITFSTSPDTSDQNYSNSTPVVIEVTTTDNEPASGEEDSEGDNSDATPRIIVLETNGSSQVDESESEDTVFVSLGTAPTSQVTINVGVDDPTEVSVNPSSTTFTSENWYVPQSITINGVDDELVDGSQNTSITFSVSPNTGDQNYTNVTPVVIVVTTTDDEASSNEGNSEGNNPVAPPIFYKRNAVCYNGGQIKVEYATAGTSVIINFNGRQIATKNISNGEVIFSNLERGTYVVEAVNVVKVINIDLDE